ncbi:hypothetical protein [Kingella negevensis]|uniref:hypothetical protein n=1 Tax=Kingella negevensis TaxID=1522312 RepID=UPI00050A0C3C|nr:hypothetical protein [Kingella negevensis]MDK4688512.1 ribbon-helix-helix protein, CopG family [Kingella negevensis]WII91753.1 ribbon-helix-helix protein, CopG family [Kingella negevensis]
MALSRTEIQRRSNEKHGIIQKKFNFDPETTQLFEQLCEQTGNSQIQVIRDALKALHDKLNAA